MRTAKTLLAATILSMIALAGNSFAQTGTFRDDALPVAQRIELAHGVLSQEGAAARDVFDAAVYMLKVRPVVKLVTAHPDFADAVISDPTLGGKLKGTWLWSLAVSWKTDATPGLAAKIAFLGPRLKSENLDARQAIALKIVYGRLVAQQATKKLQARDYEGAIEAATPVAGWSGKALEVVFKAKLRQRAPDALSWAKLVYVASDFGHTQDGIEAVSSALRSIDANLVRANAFIAFQKDGKGTNPLAGVTLPKIEFLGNSPEARAKTLCVAGDNLAALKVAIQAFATAPSGKQLNQATALVAACLRNLDGNLVRANAFVDAQSKGEPFTIAELQQ